MREFHNTGAGVSIGHIEIAVGGEAYIGGQVKGVMSRSGHSLFAKLHKDFASRIEFVDHLTRSVDNPYVVLRVHTHRVRAAGVTSSRAIDRRIVRFARDLIGFRNASHFSFAKSDAGPGAHEFTSALEIQKRLGTAVQD